MKTIILCALIMITSIGLTEEPYRVNSYKKEHRSDNDRHKEYKHHEHVKHHGYYRRHDGVIVWGVIDIGITELVIKSTTKKEVVYVEKPVVVQSEPKIVYVEKPVVIQQPVVVVPTGPVFYYPDGRLVR